ncbi:UNVERIFIED_CONTAM: hypothetical protein RMT77_001753 [Armadillidium vulgare]
MSAPLKKARAVFPIEEYESDEENIKDDFIGQTINVDFDAFKAEDGDYHGIKRLLTQSFRGLEVNVSPIVDLIISQNYVGSVVKQVNEDDDDDDEDDMDVEDEVFGISTAINLTSRKDEDAVAEIRSALVEECQKFGSDETNTFVRESLGNESKHVGLLISERLINLPPQFSMPVFESLIKEIASANKKGMAYDFTYFCMICKISKLKGKKGSKSKLEEIIWSNPEEEIFAEESIASFEYSVKGDSGLSGDWEEDDAEYLPWRRVIVFEANKLPSILCKVRQAIS